MGRHILHALWGLSNNLTTPVGELSPCSFCGHLGLHTLINCPHAETFQYGSAIKGSDNCPCCNVPIACKLCTQHGHNTEWQPAVWHYNMEAHIDSHHPEYAHPRKPVGLPLPYNIYLSLKISE
ncbi:hypothetical protein PAXRUDRAFT_777212, partial [Paxillus rubicundulus Ve08.2h10]